jgi:hypothetical protein
MLGARTSSSAISAKREPVIAGFQSSLRGSEHVRVHPRLAKPRASGLVLTAASQLVELSRLTDELSQGSSDPLPLRVISWILFATSANDPRNHTNPNYFASRNKPNSEIAGHAAACRIRKRTLAVVTGSCLSNRQLPMLVPFPNSIQRPSRHTSNANASTL